MQQDEAGGGVVPEDTPAEDERSGANVEEAVDVAAAGSQGGGTERPPAQAHPKDAPVEQVRNDPTMTGGDGTARQT